MTIFQKQPVPDLVVVIMILAETSFLSGFISALKMSFVFFFVPSLLKDTAESDAIENGRNRNSKILPFHKSNEKKRQKKTVNFLGTLENNQRLAATQETLRHEKWLSLTKKPSPFLNSQPSAGRENNSLNSWYWRKQNRPHSQCIIWPVWWFPGRVTQKHLYLFHLTRNSPRAKAVT